MPFVENYGDEPFATSRPYNKRYKQYGMYQVFYHLRRIGKTGSKKKYGQGNGKIQAY